MSKKIKEFESIIDYRFHDEKLLVTALTHPSYSSEAGLPRIYSNQRLEFLGDAVLEILVSEYLYKEHPDIEEGELTRRRSSLVFEAALSTCARAISLGEYILLGVGETQSKGYEKPSILADAFEALVGAIYLDGGKKAAKRFVKRFVIGRVEEVSPMLDAKSLMQKYVQKIPGKKLIYSTESSRTGGFVSRLYIDEDHISTGRGRSKKAAEQEAAMSASRILNIS